MRIVWVFFEGRAVSPRAVRTARLYGSIRTAFGAMPCGHTRLCARLCARPLRGRAHTLSSFSLFETESQ